IGLACIIFLRSAPPGHQATERKPIEWRMMKDVQLWSFTLVYSGSIIALRILPPWLPIYAADIFLSNGMPLNQAVLTAGALSTVYLAGRLVGMPILGWTSDRLIRHGVSRSALANGALVLTAVLFK